ncbi:MAG TPA: hypothetical protein VN840_19795 [Streptosporangiaceae bacterium]|nr:hypothetical protein [Streptosporangiaceae bacterium]
MPESLWVADLIISERVLAKISGDHNIDPFELRQAIVAVEGLRFKPRSDPPRGPRYYVEFWIGDDRVLAALYPVAHPLGDVYALGSAYREPRGLDAVGAEPTVAGEASSAEGHISEDLSVEEVDEQLP